MPLQSPAVTTYRFGPFRLVPDQRRLEREGAAVTLTPKAFDLLVTLVRHRNRALAKDELLALVWPDIVVEEGNLAQQVLLLRRALGDAGEALATLPRHGYRFVAPVVEIDERDGAVASSSVHTLQWADRHFPLREGATMIGRADDVDLQIVLPSMSRHHARIVVQGRDVTLQDLGSRHGSWRGTTRIDQAVTLAPGDEIRLGTAVLVYQLVLPGDTTSD